MNDFQNKINVPMNVMFAVLTQAKNGNFKFEKFINKNEYDGILSNLISKNTRFYTHIYKEKYFFCPTIGIEYFKVDTRNHIIRNDKEDFPYTAL